MATTPCPPPLVQIGVWDRISPIYLQAIDNRFTGVVDAVIRRATLRPAQQVLDLGTGTGSVAIKAAALVMPGGNVTAVDISPEMLELARQRSASLGLNNIEFLEGRAEELPSPTGRFDVVLASLSLMYVIDRAAATREIARVLRPAVGSLPRRSSVPPGLRQSDNLCNSTLFLADVLGVYDVYRGSPDGRDRAGGPTIGSIRACVR